MPTYRHGLGDDTERYIGHDHGYIEYRFAPGGTCEIVNIEVENGHRREGVGRLLVTELLSACREDKKASLIYAITRADNLIAQEFYEGCNFRVVGALRRFYSSSEKKVDAIMYGRSVEGPI